MGKGGGKWVAGERGNGMGYEQNVIGLLACLVHEPNRVESIFYHLD